MAKKHSKAYAEKLAKVDRESTYSPLEAVKLAKETASDKYDATIDVAMRLSVDPRKACLLYTSPSPRDGLLSRMPSSA